MGNDFHFVNFTVKWKARHRNRLAEQHDRRALSASLRCQDARRAEAAVPGPGRLCVQEPWAQDGSAPPAPLTAPWSSQHSPLAATLAAAHTTHLNFCTDTGDPFSPAAPGQFCKLLFCWLLEQHCVFFQHDKGKTYVRQQ